MNHSSRYVRKSLSSGLEGIGSLFEIDGDDLVYSPLTDPNLLENAL